MDKDSDKQECTNIMMDEIRSEITKETLAKMKEMFDGKINDPQSKDWFFVAEHKPAMAEAFISDAEWDSVVHNGKGSD